jgi:hypothetical protein
MAGNKFINRGGINTSAQRNSEGDHFHVQRDTAADLMKEDEAQGKRIDDGLPLEEPQFCEGSGASKLNKVINEECKQRGLFSDPTKCTAQVETRGQIENPINGSGELKEVSTVKQLKRLLFVEGEGFTEGKDASLNYKRLVLTCDADDHGYIIVEQLIWLLLCFRLVFYPFLANPSIIIQLSPLANYYPNDKTLGFKKRVKKMLFDVREVLEFLQTEGVNTKRLLRFKGTASMGEPHMRDLSKLPFSVSRKTLRPFSENLILHGNPQRWSSTRRIC